MGEGPQHGVSGWLLDAHHTDTDPEQQNLNDLQALYKVLFHEVIPTYYERRDYWLDMMRASIDMSHFKFSATRVVREYYELMYRRAMDSQDEITAPWMLPYRSRVSSTHIQIKKYRQLKVPEKSGTFNVVKKRFLLFSATNGINN